MLVNKGYKLSLSLEYDRIATDAGTAEVGPDTELVLEHLPLDRGRIATKACERI